MNDGWHQGQAPVRRDAMKARERTELEMLALVHRKFVFDAGMSHYCKVCGSRAQSMQPAMYHPHRPECPLEEISKRVKELGGWPPHVDDGLQWKDQWQLEAEVERIENIGALMKMLDETHPKHPQPEICSACKMLGRAT